MGAGAAAAAAAATSSHLPHVAGQASQTLSSAMLAGGELHTLSNVCEQCPLNRSQPMLGAGQPSSVQGHGPLSSHGAAKTCAAIPANNNHHDEAGAEVHWLITRCRCWQVQCCPCVRGVVQPRHQSFHVREGGGIAELLLHLECLHMLKRWCVLLLSAE